MRILNVHNRHVGAGGSELMFEALSALLRQRGHEVAELQRDNAEIRSFRQKLLAFGSAVYSPAARREMSRLLETIRPDLVHVHNLFPQFSVSVLDACREMRVPVVMHVHDYKLTCPTAQHLRNGQPCTLCLDHGEHHCLLRNCRGSWPMSVAYAARNAFARLTDKIRENVSLYLCPSDFVRAMVVRGGYPAGRCLVISNFTDLPCAPSPGGEGSYIAFVGRISPEKGIDVLLAAAARTGLPVKIAGDPASMPGVVRRAPGNIQFVGKLDRKQTADFLDAARMLVVPSIWWEAFGLVAVEAMMRGLPVIASRAGGLQEIVEHGRTGLLVPPGDAEALAAAMRRLWDDAGARRSMGAAGRAKAERCYSPEAFYASLIRAYRRVASTCAGSSAGVEGQHEFASSWNALAGAR
ncbi:MAG: glycosyltransferase [Phycisphaerae bacterium]|nr:glycosyltransferase [Phycisphaerae bacterium]